MVFMDSLPTIKEKLAFKNKLITDGKKHRKCISGHKAASLYVNLAH